MNNLPGLTARKGMGGNPCPKNEAGPPPSSTGTKPYRKPSSVLFITPEELTGDRLGDLVRHIRVSNNLSMVDLARVLGCSHVTVCRVESHHYALGKKYWDKLIELGANKDRLEYLTAKEVAYRNWTKYIKALSALRDIQEVHP